MEPPWGCGLPTTADAGNAVEVEIAALVLLCTRVSSRRLVMLQGQSAYRTRRIH